MKSPLRYPGGKFRAVRVLKEILEREYPGRKTLLSPFVGGGNFELNRAAAGYRVFANDLFRPLYVFWVMIQTRCAEVQVAVTAMLPVSKEKFMALRQGISAMTDLEAAAAYFVVNRCSYSGATFCGGYSGESAEKRMTLSSIKRLAIDLSGVTFSNLEAVEFLRQHPEAEDTVVYADPPYHIDNYMYGVHGDLHEGFDHAGFAAYLKTRRDWLLSYNDCPYIRELYAGCRIIEVHWSYGMNADKKSSEILILPGSA